MTETGVDARSSFLLDYGEGRGAQLSCTISQYGGTKAIIGCTDGWIEVASLYDSESFILHKGSDMTTYEYPFVATGKYHEAKEVASSIANGLIESKEWPLSTTVGIMKNLDEIRNQIGISYPDDMERILESN